MNSAELEFDSFYAEEDAIDRPFIETSKRRELPIGTKIVVYQGQSISKFMVDKKLVVTGANGFMLLRMYLDPLAKDSDEENEAEEQKESATKKKEDSHCDCKPKEKVASVGESETVSAVEPELSVIEDVPSIEEILEMNIPEED